MHPLFQLLIISSQFQHIFFNFLQEYNLNPTRTYIIDYFSNFPLNSSITRGMLFDLYARKTDQNYTHVQTCALPDNSYNESPFLVLYQQTLIFCMQLYRPTNQCTRTRFNMHTCNNILTLKIKRDVIFSYINLKKYQYMGFYKILLRSIPLFKKYSKLLVRGQPKILLLLKGQHIISLESKLWTQHTAVVLNLS